MLFTTNNLIVLLILFSIIAIAIIFSFEYKWNKRLFEIKRNLNIVYKKYDIDKKVYYIDISFMIIALISTIASIAIILVMIFSQ